MYEGDKLYSSIDTNHEFLLLSELPTHVSAYDCTLQILKVNVSVVLHRML